MSAEPARRHAVHKPLPENQVYDVTDGLMGVDQAFLNAVKANVQKLLLSEDMDMPRISSLANRIMRIASDPNVDIDRIVELVQTDPFLAGRILALINSAYFASRQEVSSLRHAIVLLGLKSVGDLIFSVSVKMKVFSCDTYRDLASDLWTHSVATAVGTEMLAQMRGEGDEPGFMAGLLHDVGKPVLLSAIVMTEKELGKDPVGPEAAQQLLDQLHCQVGALLAKKWRMTDVIQAAITHHEDWRDDQGPLHQYVYCGNLIAHHLGLGYHQAELVPSTDFGFNALKLTDADTVQKILDTVKEHTNRLLQTY